MADMQQPYTPPEKTEPSIVSVVMADFATVLRQNLFIQHVLVVPFIVLFTYYLGWLLTWGCLIVVTIVYSIRRVEKKKIELYEHFQSKSDQGGQFSSAQQCEWLNLIIRKYWCTCVPKLVEPHMKRVQDILEQNKPGFLYNLSVSDYQLGRRAPRIDQLVCCTELEDHRYQLDLNLHIVPDFYLDFKIEPVRRVSVKIRVDNIKVQGTARLTFKFNDMFPDASVGSLSFMGDPLVEFSIKPMGSVDMLSMPMLYEWLDEMIKSQLKPVMVWPQKIQFTLGGDQIDDELNSTEPITDITLISPDEGKAPAGYMLLSRTAGGTIPGDLSRGSGGAERYLCYKRGTDKPPITALAIIMPEKNEEPPANFSVLDETPAGESASFNIGNGGREMFLCYSRAPGIPITGLCVFNEEEGSKSVVHETFMPISITPGGHIANINKKTKGDYIRIGYRGGQPSQFGYVKTPVKVGKGILHVVVCEGRDLKAMDVGGTSDPYCQVMLEAPPPPDNPKKKMERQKKATKVITKTLEPVWNQEFAFKTTSDEVMTINVYDKDAVGKDDLMGGIRFSLASLVRGQPVDQWFTLQNVSKGEIRVSVTATDFGLDPESNSPEFLQQLEISKKAKLAGHISTVGGGAKTLGSKTVGGTLGFGSKIVGGVGAGVHAVGSGAKTGAKAAGSGAKNVAGKLAGSSSSTKRESFLIVDGQEDLEALRPGSAVSSMSGHLEKLPTKTKFITQGYKRRWFSLQADKMVYFRGQKDKVPLGSMGLKNSSLKADPSDPLHFSLVNPTKTLAMKASSREEVVEWWQALLTNIKLAKENSRFQNSMVLSDEVSEDATEMSEGSEKKEKKSKWKK